MSSTAPSIQRGVLADPDPTAVDVSLSANSLHVALSDGREISAPLAWFPRLRDATPGQQAHWELIGRGHGVHWPEIDEDVSVRGLLGKPT